MTDPPGPEILSQPELASATGFGRGTVINGVVYCARLVEPELEHRMLEHVLYEIEQLAGLYRLSVFEAANDDREFERGSRAHFRGEAIAAAYLLHVRLLDEFLYRDHHQQYKPRTSGDPNFGSYGQLPWARRPDDVVAWDFVADVERWHEQRPPRPAGLRIARERVNPAVMHLSWDRVDEGARIPEHVHSEKRQTYGVHEPYEAIREAVEALLGCLRPEAGEFLEAPARRALTAPLELPES